jgi:hypothetical protein
MQPHAIRVRKPWGHGTGILFCSKQEDTCTAAPLPNPFTNWVVYFKAHQMFQSQVNQQGVKIVLHIKILPGFNSLQALVQQYNNECNTTTLLSYKITVCMPAKVVLNGIEVSNSYIF